MRSEKHFGMEWHSVRDSLPEQNITVLVTCVTSECEGSFVTVAWRNSDAWEFYAGDVPADTAVLAWMDMPEPAGGQSQPHSAGEQSDRKELMAVMRGYVYVPTDAVTAKEALTELQQHLSEAGINADNLTVVSAELRNRIATGDTIDSISTEKAGKDEAD